jgi:nitronate monooxygenase
MTVTAAVAHPVLIQGGMGVGVSDWVLARAVALTGQLGVVSGTAVDSLMARRLQDGDPGGHVRRAMEHFPWRNTCDRVLQQYFLPEGRAPGEPYRLVPMYRKTSSRVRQQLTVLASFVEVYLAREGHDGPIGMNLLTKVQMPNLPTLYGAMLAGVDYILMGAGIPREIPEALDRLAEHDSAEMRLDIVERAKGDPEFLRFDPMEHWDEKPEPLRRPYFLPIISSDSLATMMARKATGRVDGFVIEGPTAGGHNAPPRGAPVFNERGEPVYGARDVVNLEKVAELGLPYWLAGGVGSPDQLRAARDAGAAGIQVGTLFAYCDESGLTDEIKHAVISRAAGRAVDVRTDALASPTGFPFKVVDLEGSLSDEGVYAQRERICDLGYLREAYRTENGKIDYRCAAEPVEDYVRKGGNAADTAGRRCLCNALMADIGHAQVRGEAEEAPLVTSGDDLRQLGAFVGSRSQYSAADVVDFLLA